MDAVKQILVTILTSSLVVGLLVFLLRQYITRWIAHEFERRDREIQRAERTEDRVGDLIVEKRLGIYPELSELVYRLKNILFDLPNRRNAVEWDNHLRPLSAQLSEDLYKFRFFLDKDLFNHFHEFKRISQDAVMLQDTLTRDDTLFDQAELQARLTAFRDRIDRAGELNDVIQESIKDKVKHIKEVL